jgi:hypothetical protein
VSLQVLNQLTQHKTVADRHMWTQSPHIATLNHDGAAGVSVCLCVVIGSVLEADTRSKCNGKQ